MFTFFEELLNAIDGRQATGWLYLFTVKILFIFGGRHLRKMLKVPVEIGKIIKAAGVADF